MKTNLRLINTANMNKCYSVDGRLLKTRVMENSTDLHPHNLEHCALSVGFIWKGERYSLFIPRKEQEVNWANNPMMKFALTKQFKDYSYVLAHGTGQEGKDAFKKYDAWKNKQEAKEVAS